MKFVVFDLEWNSPRPGVPPFRIGNRQLPFEIMEVGAIKMNETGQIEAEFHRRVKARIYKKINPYIAKVTKTSNADLKTGKDFIEVYDEFIDFIKDEEDVVLATWSTCDFHHLENNLLFYRSVSKIDFQMIDVQRLYASFIEHNNCQRSLKVATENLHITIEDEDFHAAIVDARYTALVLKQILDLPENQGENGAWRNYIFNPCEQLKVKYRVYAKNWEKLKNQVSNEIYTCPSCTYKLKILPPGITFQGGRFRAVAQCKWHGEVKITGQLTTDRNCGRRFASVTCSRDVLGRSWVLEHDCAGVN